MKISSVKIISLLFFVLSAFYLYTAYQIQVFSFDENAPFNAKTFPIYLGYIGMLLAGLKIILPERIKEEVDHKVLDYKKVIFLVIIMIFYGLTILRVGFFLSTSFFLLFAYYFLGERRWKWMLIFSFPFVALFVFLLHGILDIYLRDPFLKLLGVIG
ncbi:MAG: tripartite tricarboxylate transporter TctB family protein [Pelagibacteraceae bacterium]|nr:tripartite tricarboxylate transporter TctB family protein [Pelagibacteraceae bacterium]MDP6785044.1 tripartite tricarboxylate transporter TctB family protein [Alphaproteobacteria bacterium]